MVGSGRSGGSLESTRLVVSSSVGVVVEEQFESTSVSGAQVLDEDVFEILQGHGGVTVSIVGKHELESFFPVSWVVNVQRTVKIRDHLSGFH